MYALNSENLFPDKSFLRPVRGLEEYAGSVLRKARENVLLAESYKVYLSRLVLESARDSRTGLNDRVIGTIDMINNLEALALLFEECSRNIQMKIN